MESTASSSAVISESKASNNASSNQSRKKLAINDFQNDFPPVFVFLQKASIIKKSNLSQSEIDRSSGNF